MQNRTDISIALDTRGAARLLGVSKSHLEKLRTEDPENSPPFFRVGRCIRYSSKQLTLWVEARSNDVSPSSVGSLPLNPGR